MIGCNPTTALPKSRLRLWLDALGFDPGIPPCLQSLQGVEALDNMMLEVSSKIVSLAAQSAGLARGSFAESKLF